MSPWISTRLLSAQSDQRLLELARTGHERAFEAIVLRYRRPMLAYSRRMGLSDSRGEDVMQQALLQAWTALQRGGEVRELRPWLYRIVHNTTINALRRSPEERLRVGEGALLESVAAAPTLEQGLAARQALGEVAALPPMQREALLLSAIDGRSHGEVASALGISDGAVRGLLYRARCTLRGAAAALTPQPLLAWACGGASRVAPTAARVAELSSSGSGELGGMLVKGAAVCVTAAIAAGAVLGPLHRGAARARAGAGAAGLPAPRWLARSAASGAAPSAAAQGQSARPVSSTALLPGVQPPVGSSRALARSSPAAGAPGSGGGATTVPPGLPVSAQSSPTSASPTTGADGATTSGHVAESGSAGSSGGQATGPAGEGTHGSQPPSGGKEGSGTETGQTGGGESEGGGGSGASEAEREHAESEAEEARERKEREAEEAQERREREAEAMRGSEPGKDE